MVEYSTGDACISGDAQGRVDAQGKARFFCLLFDLLNRKRNNKSTRNNGRAYNREVLNKILPPLDSTVQFKTLLTSSKYIWNYSY